MIPLLEGVTIVEIGAVVLGPYAGQMLADLGAEVIKVEPLEGDISRAAFPRGQGGGALFLNNNRNKAAIALDLKRPEAKAVIAQMIAGADVLFHNMRPAAAERLGLGYEACCAHNPELIYCAAIGYGQAGPYRDRPAFDDVIQAASGLAGLPCRQGRDPAFVGSVVGDKVAALHAVYGILAALTAKARGRSGPVMVEVPMYESLVAFLMNEHLAAATFEAEGALGYPRVLSPDRKPHRTADGWLAVLPYTGEQWRRFLREAGRAEVIDTDWFGDEAVRPSRIDTLYRIVAETLPTRSSAEWCEAFERLDIPFSPVRQLEDLLDDPHLAATGFFDTDPSYPEGIKRMLPQPVLFHGVEKRPDRPSPALGADSLALLERFGFDAEERSALVASGIVGIPPEREG